FLGRLVLPPLASTDYLPVLHSFPTRRSSDLLGRQLPVERGDLHLAGGRHPGGAPPAHAPSLRALGGPSRPGGHPPVLEGPPRARDRKSTRLNSSHVKISYAVFCLKKKTV